MHFLFILAIDCDLPPAKQTKVHRMSAMVWNRPENRSRKYDQEGCGARKGKLHFDYLPRDGLTNIIRSTKDRPRSVSWKSHFETEVVFGFLTSKTMLAECCRSQFSTLEACIDRLAEASWRSWCPRFGKIWLTSESTEKHSLWYWTNRSCWITRISSDCLRLQMNGIVTIRFK